MSSTTKTSRPAVKWGQIEVEPLPRASRAAKEDTTRAPEPEPAARADAVSPTRSLPPTRGAEAIVRKWALWSAGFGLVPIPLVDFAATAGFSLKMLRDLAHYYRLEFRREAGKASIAALVGGLSAPATALAANTLLKSIPVLGLPLTIVSGPVLAGSMTYAAGKVFTAHFGAGGTLFDFDPEKFRDYFQEQIRAGKTIIRASAS